LLRIELEDVQHRFGVPRRLFLSDGRRREEFAPLRW
jgi:hypothetical protein